MAEKPIVDMNKVAKKEERMIYHIFKGRSSSRKKRIKKRKERLLNGEIILDKPEFNPIVVPHNIEMHGKRRYRLYLEGNFNNFKDFKRIEFYDEEPIIVPNEDWITIMDIPENEEPITNFLKMVKKLTTKKKPVQGASVPLPKRKPRGPKKTVVMSEYGSTPTPKTKHQFPVPDNASLRPYWYTLSDEALKRINDNKIAHNKKKYKPSRGKIVSKDDPVVIRAKKKFRID